MDLNYNQIPQIFHNSKNIIKTYEVLAKQLEKMKKLDDDLIKSRNIEFLEGVSLDEYASEFGVFRNGRNDKDVKDEVRFIKLSYNFSGSVQDVVKILNFYFSTTGFSVKELEAKLSIIVPGGIDIDEVKSKINKLRAAGVSFLVDNQLYIIDYTFTRLEAFTFDYIEKNMKFRR